MCVQTCPAPAARFLAGDSPPRRQHSGEAPTTTSSRSACGPPASTRSGTFGSVIFESDLLPLLLPWLGHSPPRLRLHSGQALPARPTGRRLRMTPGTNNPPRSPQLIPLPTLGGNTPTKVALGSLFPSSAAPLGLEPPASARSEKTEGLPHLPSTAQLGLQPPASEKDEKYFKGGADCFMPFFRSYLKAIAQGAAGWARSS